MVGYDVVETGGWLAVFPAFPVLQKEKKKLKTHKKAEKRKKKHY